MKRLEEFILEKLKISKIETNYKPKNKEELIDIIIKEIEENGPDCSLNHIDVSNITDMSCLFMGGVSWKYTDGHPVLSKFDGDISGWNVSNVTNMNFMFNGCSSLTTLIDGHESDSYLECLYKLKVNIDLSQCVKLNYESVYAVFNGLEMVTGKTITLPSVMKGKLNEIKLKIPKRKGWTVAYK